MPKSLPVIPVAPNKRLYSLPDLYLFKTYSRKTYLQEFGESAPPWEFATVVTPAQPMPIKRWFDSSFDNDFDKDTIVTYQICVLNQSGYPEMQNLQLTKAAAGKINLPGFDPYPEYKPEPTYATFRDGNASTPVDPYMLSTLDQAGMLAKELRLSMSDVAQHEGTVAWPLNETRRIHEINWHGVKIPVGYLLKERYKTGIHSEGEWRGLTWVSHAQTPMPSIDSRPEIAVPCRSLNPDEEFTNNMLDRFEIRRNSISDSPFNSSDRELLNKVWTALQAGINS